MPDHAIDARDVMLQLTWDGADFAGRGRIRLTEQDVVVEVAEATRVFRLPYTVVRGADLRQGALTVYAAHARLVALSGVGIERVWIALQERVCALPEFTVGLRALGSRQGGDAAMQGRFFGPLLAARRRLEEQQDVHWRLAAFDATELRQRLDGVLRDLVAERTVESSAQRRSLQARAQDEAEQLERALEALAEAADVVRGAPDDERFEAWRAWSSRARAVFVEADRCWLAVRALLEETAVITPRRRRPTTRPRAGEGP